MSSIEQAKLHIKLDILHDKLVRTVKHIEYNDSEIGIKNDLLLIKKIVIELIKIYNGD